MASAPEGAARALLERFGVEDPSHIRLEEIAWRLGLLVLDGPLKGADARLLAGGNRGVIRVRESIRWSGQRRFAIAHEMGHWVLHKGDSQWWASSGGSLDAYTTGRQEEEASRFAAELLMPEFLFAPRVQDGRFDFNRLIELANTFGSSLSSAAVQFARYTTADGMSVLSQDGEVRRAYRSAGGRMRVRSLRKRIGADALLHRSVFREPLDIHGPAEVPWSAWFETDDPGGSLVEESAMLVPAKAALTLLRLDR